MSLENHFDYYENKMAKSKARDLAELKAEYEAKDWEIFHSSWRKNQGYIPHGTRRRTITTIFGDLTYPRHRYRYWDKYRYRFVCLSDLEMGVEKYQRVSSHLQIKMLEKVAEGKRYRDILDDFPNVRLSTKTVSNIIRRTRINNFDEIIDGIEKVKIENCLYINLDDTFLSLRKKNKKKQK